jgi:hypothetical protein
LKRLPHYLKEDCTSHKAAETYSKKHFLEHTNEYFEVRHAGYLGIYPLFVMNRRMALANDNKKAAGRVYQVKNDGSSENQFELKQAKGLKT